MSFMEKKKKYLLLVCISIIAVISMLTILFSGRYGDKYVNMALRDKEYGASHWSALDDNDIVTEVSVDKMKVNGQVIKGEEAVLSQGSTLSVPIQVEKEGTYQLVLEYKPVNAKVMDGSLTVRLDGKEYNASVPLLWADASNKYAKDRYGNDLNPQQICVDDYVLNTLVNSNTIEKSSLELPFKAATSELNIVANRQDFIFKSVYLIKKKEIQNYAQYLAKNKSEEKPKDLIVLEAESYNVKSDSFIRGKGIKNPNLSPYNTYTRPINVVDDSSWSEKGQKILWEFDVQKTGLYQIGFRYSQPSEANKETFRQIEIDGQVPFSEFEVVPFSTTNLDEYKNCVLSKDGKAFQVYLTAGKHTISMKAVMGPMKDAYNEIISIMKEISDMGMDLKKMTAGVTDKNRTWDMQAYLPDIPKRMSSCADRIDTLYKSLWNITGEEPVYANDLTYASDTLRSLLKDLRTLPNKTELLSVGDNSVSSTLGNILDKLTEQPLGLDRIYIFSGTEVPKDSVPVLTSFSESVKSFVKTFMPGAASNNYQADYVKDSKELQVWINMPIQKVQVLQQILDGNYNVKYGTNIQLSVMPNEQKLILANVTKTNPDVAIGLNFFLPYEFAIRGGAKNLLEYDDFLKFYNDQYNLEGLTPVAYDNGIYGAVDSINFQVMFYRKDILQKLGLSVPNTWDDVVHMMPQLLRYSMNFNTPMANNIGFKPFSATAPFLYQNNGDFYTPDGLSTDFKSKESIEGFTQMTELYQIDALQKYVANFYNSFRYGEVPIGIGGFFTYLQLQIAAPELTGAWDIAPIPGQLQKDGTVLRYQPADSTSSMIFENTKKSEESWRFLKWWLSKETQAQFAYDLENTYGAEYRWNTANIKAFEELPYPEKQKSVILQQLSWQKETPRNPAGYMVERDASNIWNNVVANGKELSESIDQATIESNREIQRKLREFGFIGEDGKVIKTYPTDTIEKLKRELQK
jgi:ABC-type glycerol-3-phosphate transport system substrate-binding protein